MKQSTTDHTSSRRLSKEWNKGLQTDCLRKPLVSSLSTNTEPHCFTTEASGGTRPPRWRPPPQQQITRHPGHAMGTLSKTTPDNKDDKAAPLSDRNVAQQLNKGHNGILEANGYQGARSDSGLSLLTLFYLLCSFSSLFFTAKAFLHNHHSSHRCFNQLNEREQIINNR